MSGGQLEATEMFRGRENSFDGRAGELAREFEVDEVFDASFPLWYWRLTARCRLTWRRELTALASILAGGVVAGFAIGRLI